MITIEDIDIFIMTCNRADFLEASIKSVLQQTVSPDKITILNNDPIDDKVIELVNRLNDKKIKYIETHGFLGNFKTAKQLASRKYCMLFHDDDLLNKDYFKYAIKVLNTVNNVSLITTRNYRFKTESELLNLQQPSHELIIFNSNTPCFARYMIAYIDSVSYAPSIYNTTAFKLFNDDYDQFGKFNDYPFIAKFSRVGNVVLFTNRTWYLYRQHQKSDSNNATTMPTIQQIVNWNIFFLHECDLCKNINEIQLFFKQSTHYMFGKYQMLSDDVKKQYSFNDVLNVLLLSDPYLCKNKDKITQFTLNTKPQHELVNYFYNNVKMFLI